MYLVKRSANQSAKKSILKIVQKEGGGQGLFKRLRFFLKLNFKHKNYLKDGPT